VPALVTTSPDGTSQENAGVLGEATTTVLFGEERIVEGSRAGGQIMLGFWDPSRNLGMEATYTAVERKLVAFARQSDGSPILARPFLNLESGANDAELIAFEDLISGGVNITAATEFDAAELLLRQRVLQNRLNGLRIELLTGYRYSRLEDGLQISQNVEALSGIAQGSMTDLLDRFQTENAFHGGLVGAAVARQRGYWGLELQGKIALGNTRSVSMIDGNTFVTDVAGGTATSPFGFLTRKTNIGRVVDNDFAVIPELGATLRYDLTYRLTATLGYQFIYWSRVARAGDQIDLEINLSDPLVGAERPAPTINFTDFWAQGIDIGLEFRF
jgi:hypothetical protein